MNALALAVPSCRSACSYSLKISPLPQKRLKGTRLKFPQCPRNESPETHKHKNKSTVRLVVRRISCVQISSLTPPLPPKNTHAGAFANTPPRLLGAPLGEPSYLTPPPQSGCPAIANRHHLCRQNHPRRLLYQPPVARLARCSDVAGTVSAKGLRGCNKNW